VAYGNGIWLIGYDAGILYSSDGTNWTGIPASSTNFSNGGYGVAWTSGLGSVSGSDISLNRYGSGIVPYIGNKLDIVAPPYYQNGYSNISISITPT
jgi:hypothetical protein